MLRARHDFAGGPGRGTFGRTGEFDDREFAACAGSHHSEPGGRVSAVAHSLAVVAGADPASDRDTAASNLRRVGRCVFGD
ncbi:hypothetical protein [Lysobacter xanthus]